MRFFERDDVFPLRYDVCGGLTGFSGDTEQQTVEDANVDQ